MKNSTYPPSPHSRKIIHLRRMKASLFFFLIIFGFAGWLPAQQVAPGGVSQGLSLWVKADQGVLTTGTAVTGWNDYSGNDRNLTTSTATYQPSFTAATPIFNFHPTLTFQNDFLRYTGNVLPKNSNASIFTVLNQTQQSGYRTVWDFITNDPGLHVYANNWTLYHGGNSNYHSLKSEIGKTTLMSAHWEHDIAATSFVEINGRKELANRRVTTNGNNYYIGAGSSGAAEPWIGHIAENIVYDQPILGADLQKVNTYLAVKYGITLDNDISDINNNYDYLSSASTMIWNGIANATYHHNIFGIGRDDLSGLTQLKSKSINKGSNLIIEIASIQNDGSFMMVGDNNGIAKLATLYTPNSFVSTLPFYHLGRIWKVQETGTIGTVTLSLTGLNVTYLLVHYSSDFTSGTPLEIPVVDGAVTIDLEDNQYFTFAGPATGPGGVYQNLAVWLKADEGTNTTTTGGFIDTWNDLSGNERTHTQPTASRQPIFVGENASNLMSYNPAVRFERVALGLQTDFLSVPNFLNSSDAVHTFIVSRINGAGLSSWQTLYSFTADATHPDWYLQNPSVRVGGTERYANSKGIKYAIAAGILPKGSNHRIIWNGTTRSYPEVTYNITGTSTEFTLGVDRNITDPFDGDIQEVIIYAVPGGGDMSAADILQIQSYLAIKYGITLDNAECPNYMAGDGTTIIWNGDNNAGYQNHIFGIGRDSKSSLNQKQAYSYSDSSISIYIGSLAKLNMLNNEVIAGDNAYLILGNNNATGNTSLDYPVGTSFQNATTTERINVHTNKIWKAQATTIGTWDINIKTTRYSFAKYVMVSNNNAFDPATTRIYPVVNGHAMNVEVNDGDYIRISSFNTSPGGVHNGLALWLRADIGVNGAPVTEWMDQSGLGNDLIQGNTQYSPTFVESSVLGNFNPSLKFLQNSLYRAQNFVPNTSGSGVSVFTAAYSTSIVDSYKALWDFYVNNPSLHLRNDRWDFFNAGGDHPTVGTINKTTIANAHWIIGSIGSRVNEIDGYAETQIGLNATHSISQYILGAGSVTDVEDWQGDIMENIIYTEKLVDDDLIKVNTYLALKYGVTLKNPATYQYLSTNGTLIWDGATNAAYHNNIAGIGRDDIELLYQKQGKSVNPGSQITMGINSIETSNAANTAVIENDGAYLIWGDNGIANNNTTFLQYNPVVTINHLQRIWKVENTSLTNKLKIQFPAAMQPGALTAPCEGYKLLIFSDPSDIANSMISIEALNEEDDDYHAEYTFPAGASYFTIARVNPASLGSVYLPLEDMQSQTYSSCSMNDWNYFYESATASQKLVGMNDFTEQELDNFTINITVSGVNFDNGTRTTNIMPRVTTVTDASNGTYSGGKIRIYYDTDEMANTQIPGAVTNSWFKYDGNAVDALSDILADGVFVSATAIALTPDASGVEDGVNYVEFHNITSFSTFMFISSSEETGVVLPIVLGDFNLVKQTVSIRLEWFTHSENNNKGFEIQKALPNGQWQSIGFVPSNASNGNSSIRTDYSFVDTKPTIGNNAYRLKQIDFDNQFSYTPIQSVSYQATVAIGIQPNPVVNQATITGLIKGDKLQLFNAAGQLVYTTVANNNILQIDMSSFGIGTYYLQTFRNGASNTLKILKVK